MSTSNSHSRFLDRLPREWRVAAISDLGTVIGGSTPSRGISRFWVGPHPWVTPGELTALGDKYIRSTRETISRAGLNSCGAKLLPPDSLLITSRATIGGAALAGVEIATNQGFKSVVFADDMSPSYFYHLFKVLIGELERRASGTTFLEISSREFSAVRVPVPPFLEQRQIAEILDTVDEAIHKTEELVAKLKQVKQGLLHDLLTRGIDDNGELRDPERHPELFKDSLLGRIPNVWHVQRLAEVYAENSKNGLYKPAKFHGRGPLMVQMGNIFRGLNVSFDGAGRVAVTSSEMRSYGLRVGDLLFGRRSLVLEGAGKCSLVRELPEASTFESSIVRVRLDEKRVLPPFAALHLSSERSYRDRRRYIRQVAVSGVSSADIGAFLVVLPRVGEQAEILGRVDALDVRISNEMAFRNKLRLLKTGLMEDLLTGRVRVTPLLEQPAP